MKAPECMQWSHTVQRNGWKMKCLKHSKEANRETRKWITSTAPAWQIVNVVGDLEYVSPSLLGELQHSLKGQTLRATSCLSHCQSSSSLFWGNILSLLLLSFASWIGECPEPLPYSCNLSTPPQTLDGEQWHHEGLITRKTLKFFFFFLEANKSSPSFTFCFLIPELLS